MVFFGSWINKKWYLLCSILKGMKEDDLQRFSLLLSRSIPPELMSIWMLRMKLKVSSGGMARGNNGRKEMSFLTPGKHCFTRGPKERGQQESVFIKEFS